MKKLCRVILLAMLFCCLTGNALAAADMETSCFKETVFLSPHSDAAIVNGKTVNGVKPVLVDNRTLVPVRFVAEAFHGKVDWDGKKNTVTIAIDDKTIGMQIDKKAISINGTVKTIDVAPCILQDSTYLPLRTLGDALGKETVYDEATDVVMISNPDSEPIISDNFSMEEIKWLLQGQPVIYMDDSYVFLDQGNYLTVWDRSRQVAQKLGEKGGFISPAKVVDGVSYYLIYTDEPTAGSDSLYAVQDKQISLLLRGDIADFKIHQDNLYLLTNEFADYFSTPSHTVYEGNLYWVPLKEANGSWDNVKHFGMPGYLYGFQVELKHYDLDTLMVWQRIGEAQWNITDQGIEAIGVDLRTTSPEESLGYYRIPLDGSPHKKLRSLKENEFDIVD